MIEKNSFKLSVIVPCYNEKKTIEKILKKIISSLNNYQFSNYEIIIIDDNSTDGTTELLKNLTQDDKIKIYFHDKNLGKGAAIKSATPYIKGDIVAIQDADLEYNPTDLNKLIKIMISKDLRVIYGSRVLKKKRYNSDMFISNFRIFGNHV